MRRLRDVCDVSVRYESAATGGRTATAVTCSCRVGAHIVYCGRPGERAGDVG